MSEKEEVTQSVRDRLKYQDEHKKEVEFERQQKRIDASMNSATSMIRPPYIMSEAVKNILKAGQ